MKIVIGSDHAGYEYKNKFVEYLKAQGYEVIDVGCDSDESVDYPLYGYKIGHAVIDNNCFGIGICGSGIGISIACNKVQGIRAVNATTLKQAHLARKHNDCNVICFGQRLVSFEKCIAIFDEFIVTEANKGRHARRVKLLNEGDK